MGLPDASEDLSSEIEVNAFRRLFSLFASTNGYQPGTGFEQFLTEYKLVAKYFGPRAVRSSDGSALVKIGSTTMLAAIMMEVMIPLTEFLDGDCIAIEFHMPPICFPLVRPGRPAGTRALISGKAGWMAYLDVYCLDVDGVLFDAALLSAVAALSHLRIPQVFLNDDGRIVVVSEEGEGKIDKELVNKEKRELNLTNIPFSLTCILHKGYILADLTAEEESVMETLINVVLDSSGQIVSLYKPGCPVLAHTSVLKDCVELIKKRAVELHEILNEAISDMDVESASLFT
uniref:Exoribonuclease phosphorolytic domain-containing protein n=1 Tax=Kalanchoe fedtschenkoi TaxID=63787 RepID=A0A7N0UHP0_KALFE